MSHVPVDRWLWNRGEHEKMFSDYALRHLKPNPDDSLKVIPDRPAVDIPGTGRVLHISKPWVQMDANRLVRSALVADLLGQRALLRWETGHKGQFYEGTATDADGIRVKPEIRSMRMGPGTTEGLAYRVAAYLPGLHIRQCTIQDGMTS